MKSTRKMTNTIFAMLLGLLVIAASNQAFAQGGNWETKAPMPTARYGTAGGVISDKLYVAGGQSGPNLETNFFATLEVYDPATDTWATKAPMPTPRVLAGAVAIDGKLYVVGGLGVQPQRWLTTLEVYDPATDTWATKAPMPTPRDWEGAVAIDGKLYVVGGCMGGCAPATGVLEVYDPATNIWTTKAPMPTARGAAGVEVVNGLLYVMGGGWGWDSSDSELKARTIEVYNPTTNIWTTRNQHVVGVGGTAGSFNGKIYLAGFAALTPVLTNAEVYDPATYTWASLSPMPTGRYIATGGVINGKLYVAGGTDATYVGLATLEAFTPSCTYTLSPQEVVFTPVSGTGSITLTASSNSCAWTATSNDSWITITSGSRGSGNGTVGYSVAANNGLTRTGTMTIGGQTFTITQSGANAYFDTVQKIYIGYYQRPADPAGLIYWAERLNASNGNLTEIIEAFSNSDESRTLYGTINSGNISTVVNNIYLALFNRDAEAGGRDYWVNGFNSGQLTAATIMLNVLDGAQNEDLQSVNNKLTAANLFTKTIDPELDGSNFQVTYAGDGDVIAGRNFLAFVTSNLVTVPTQAETTAYIQTNIADPGDTIGESPFTPTVLESASQTITAAQGGTIILPGGSSVTIPAGALASDQTVRLSLLSSLPKQPPSGSLASVGPALVLDFDSRQTASPQAGNLTFVIRYGATLPARLTGSAPLVNVVASDNFFGGVPISCESSSECFVIPLSTIQNTQSISAASVNLSTEITLAPPPRFGPRIWNGSVWLDYPQGFDPSRKTLVLTHGILSTVEGSFGSSLNEIMSQGGYQQVVGFNYDYARNNIVDAGQKFANFLNSLQTEGGLTQIDIQAHSFGTLVALYAASQTDLTINNMILEGGPLEGTSAADISFHIDVPGLPEVDIHAPGLLTLLANYEFLGRKYATTFTFQEALDSGMFLDAQPGNPLLKTIRTNALNRHPNTNYIKIFGSKSMHGPIVTGFLFGAAPNDGMVPVSDTIGADLPGPTYIVSEQHDKLQSNSYVLKFIGQNLVNTYTPPTCTFFTYSAWSECQSNNTQTRTVVTTSPTGCVSGTPVLSQSCTYIPPSSFTLTITTTGTGNGTVSANPSGPSYTAGTTVALTASPDSNSVFTGWSGACAGTQSTCTLNMTASKSVTATFTSNPSGTCVWGGKTVVCASYNTMTCGGSTWGWEVPACCGCPAGMKGIWSPIGLGGWDPVYICSCP